MTCRWSRANADLGIKADEALLVDCMILKAPEIRDDHLHEDLSRAIRGPYECAGLPCKGALQSMPDLP